MKEERGQLFTFDMLLAMILISLLVVTTGQVTGLVRERGTEYINRYSLERRASNAADILVRNSGQPTDWEDNIETLEIPGLAYCIGGDTKVANQLDPNKLNKLALALENDSIDNSLREFFGTEKFEITVKKDDHVLMRMWPGWSQEQRSGKENSLEVASAERLVYGSTIVTRAESPPLIRAAGLQKENLRFRIYQDELEIYDWYIYMEKVDDMKGGGQIFVNVNRPTPGLGGGSGGQDFQIQKSEVAVDGYEILPEAYSGIEEVPSSGNPSVDNNLEEERQNYISVKFAGNEKSLKVYVLAIPANNNPQTIHGNLHENCIKLRVSVWR